ncbi:hypothetical protein ACFOSU_09935 [Salinisphaera aquimarina]|uniref:Uncharacterized protein n=2 Tax=Salinisphaera aquimarina TaxID=2094031 RepID=A0ABV7ENE9_9GAMM
MSWSFLHSAITHAQNTGSPPKAIDFNVGSPAVVILACSAIEAFVNEVSSSAHSFLFDADRDSTFISDPIHDRWDAAGIEESDLQKIASIRVDESGSLIDRYKRLLKAIDLELPARWNNLCQLQKVRNGLVHFRECDIPIVNDKDSRIRSGQKLPDFLLPLTRQKIESWPILASNPEIEGEDWTLRIATNAFSIWALEIAMTTNSYILDNLAEGKYAKHLRALYSSRERHFDHLFEMGLDEISNWKDYIYKGYDFRTHFKRPFS